MDEIDEAREQIVLWRRDWMENLKKLRPCRRFWELKKPRCGTRPSQLCGRTWLFSVEKRIDGDLLLLSGAKSLPTELDDERALLPGQRPIQQSILGQIVKDCRSAFLVLYYCIASIYIPCLTAQLVQQWRIKEATATIVLSEDCGRRDNLIVPWRLLEQVAPVRAMEGGDVATPPSLPRPKPTKSVLFDSRSTTHSHTKKVTSGSVENKTYSNSNQRHKNHFTIHKTTTQHRHKLNAVNITRLSENNRE